jgi:predicted MFS family arabinose efflux permease
MGTLGAIVSCFEILGAILFFKMCKKINIKKWLYISVFLGAITTLCYLHFTPITAIIYGILFSILGMFIHLIVMSWMAKTTLPGKEATSFALLCSINNLAGTASSLSGAFLFPKIGLQPLIIVSAVTSFLCLPLIKKLKIGGKDD